MHKFDAKMHCRLVFPDVFAIICLILQSLFVESFVHIDADFSESLVLPSIIGANKCCLLHF